MTTDQTSRAMDVARLLGWRGAAAVPAGLLTGGFAAWAYYDDTYRPLSHTFGLWITLVAVLSVHSRPAAAVLRSGLALAAAVLAFYNGKDVVYGIEYPGMPYSVNVGLLVQWLVLAGVAGVVLGWTFSTAGRDGAAGARGTAAIVALLAADAYRPVLLRGGSDVPSPVGLLAGVVAVLVVIGTVRTPRQLLQVGAWTVPLALAAFALVSAPDLLEQLLISLSS